MKKLFTLVAMALMAVGTNAQTTIWEENLAGLDAVPYWFGSSEGTDATAEATADGIALMNPRKQDQIWTPQTVVTADGFTVEEDHNYKVIIEVKVPAGEGTYQVQLGSWATNFQKEVPVVGNDDWQTLEIDFPEYGGSTDENAAHVVFQNGWVVGTSVVKSVKVIEYGEEGEEGGETEEAAALIWEENLAGLDAVPYWFGSSEGTDATAEATADGIALMNPRKQDQIWTPQTVVTADAFTVEEDHNYLVVIEVKVPAGEGTYQVQLGSWATNFQKEVPVVGNDDWQTLEIEFPEYGGTTDENAAHVVFQNGWVVGTSVVKSVKVYEVSEETAIQSVKKAAKANGAIYNLAGQKVNASYKGVVIKDGKKYIQK